MRTSKRARQLATDVESLIMVSPHLHDQESYYVLTNCGTTACVAGWATVMSGYQPIFDGVEGDGVREGFRARRFGDGPIERMWDVAKNRLGLNSREAWWLFAGSRSRDDVLSGLACIREGNPTKLAELIKNNNDEDDE